MIFPMSLFPFLETREYCLTESFEATCADDEAILVTEARFGRIGLGRCVTRNYGYLGCSKVRQCPSILISQLSRHAVFFRCRTKHITGIFNTIDQFNFKSTSLQLKLAFINSKQLLPGKSMSLWNMWFSHDNVCGFAILCLFGIRLRFCHSNVCNRSFQAVLLFCF